MFISDCSKLGEYAYRAETTQGNIKAQAYIKETVIRRGAYEMTAYAVNTTRRPLGSKQQRIAADLKLEMRGNLGRALYAARWTSEQITWGGQEIILWWPPQS